MKWLKIGKKCWALKDYLVVFQPGEDLPFDVFGEEYINSYATLTEAQVVCEKKMGL